MIVIGESGNGKSTCCNILAGESHDSTMFPATEDSQLRTQQTTIKHVYFKGNPDRPYTLIDTQGFNDPGVVGGLSKEKDQEIVTELMKSLYDVGHINLFLICINGTNLRLNASLLNMLKIFEDIFGHSMENDIPKRDPDIFWKKCMIVLTKLPMDQRSIERRVGRYDVSADKLSLQRQLNEAIKICKKRS